MPSSQPVHKNKMTLNTREWKSFNLNDLFDISSSSDELINDLNEGGATPYVTSSDTNNGVTSYVKEAPTNPAKTITANRGGSVGFFYYQPEAYMATPVDVRILKPKFEINVYVGLFLKTVLQLEKYRFNYCRKMGSARLNKMVISLPQKDGELDLEYMEQYIKSLPNSQIL